MSFCISAKALPKMLHDSGKTKKKPMNKEAMSYYCAVPETLPHSDIVGLYDYICGKSQTNAMPQ